MASNRGYGRTYAPVNKALWQKERISERNTFLEVVSEEHEEHRSRGLFRQNSEPSLSSRSDRSDFGSEADADAREDTWATSAVDRASQAEEREDIWAAYARGSVTPQEADAREETWTTCAVDLVSQRQKQSHVLWGPLEELDESSSTVMSSSSTASSGVPDTAGGRTKAASSKALPRTDQGVAQLRADWRSEDHAKGGMLRKLDKHGVNPDEVQFRITVSSDSRSDSEHSATGAPVPYAVPAHCQPLSFSGAPVPYAVPAHAQPLSFTGAPLPYAPVNREPLEMPAHGQLADDRWGDELSENSDKPDPDNYRLQQAMQQEVSVLQSMGAEEFAELMQRVPLDINGRLTSIGSIGHAQGNCKPCIFSESGTGCVNDIACGFCHFSHKREPRKNKMRPCKGKRDRYRKLVTRLSVEQEANPEAFNLEGADLPPSIAASELKRSKLNLAIQQRREDMRAGICDQAPMQTRIGQSVRRSPALGNSRAFAHPKTQGGGGASCTTMQR